MILIKWRGRGEDMECPRMSSLHKNKSVGMSWTSHAFFLMGRVNLHAPIPCSQICKTVYMAKICTICLRGKSFFPARFPPTERKNLASKLGSPDEPYNLVHTQRKICTAEDKNWKMIWNPVQNDKWVLSKFLTGWLKIRIRRGKTGNYGNGCSHVVPIPSTSVRG